MGTISDTLIIKHVYVMQKACLVVVLYDKDDRYRPGININIGCDSGGARGEISSYGFLNRLGYMFIYIYYLRLFACL